LNIVFIMLFSYITNNTKNIGKFNYWKEISFKNCIRNDIAKYISVILRINSIHNAIGLGIYHSSQDSD
jgi:hypothetical protein